MGWIYREADVHKCMKPHWDIDVERGDRWQCDECHLVWRVADIKTHYDDYSNYEGGTLTWEIYTTPGVTSWRDQ